MALNPTARVTLVTYLEQVVHAWFLLIYNQVAEVCEVSISFPTSSPQRSRHHKIDTCAKTLNIF